MYLGEVGCDFEVYRNDEVTVEDLKRMNPRGILISPGPGAPQDSGISLETVLELGPSIPLFGVCMGLQCIGEAFGGKVVRAPGGVMHGKSSLVYYDEKEEDGLFSGLSNPFTAGRYHSLVVEKESFPSKELEITAWTDDGLIMAARHRKYKHLQFGYVTASLCTVGSPLVTASFNCLLDRGDYVIVLTMRQFAILSSPHITHVAPTSFKYYLAPVSFLQGSIRGSPTVLC
ncbi:anthranilate synthase beta subunit 2, chloroplastic-like isoform X3 [Juglans microcarpa x Juglans regia]|uniref:anthranilate synthase beta subunit 2, chloroplastic-like isoform X3 n=1 Tax=Juglans microcarpa x Juglans regia TaxID=2249226 RepID=UPI001B7E5BC2|nr:anthranilate synthase beta subunit 2, chloroplastic-like isoform X3 [Juglans microcarpa x Juglans regia]